MPTGIYKRTIKYKKEHSIACKGKSGIYKRTKKHKLAHKKLMNSSKIKNKIRKKVIELWKNTFYRNKQVKAHLGYQMPKAQKKKISEWMKKNSPHFDVHKFGKEATNYIHGEGKFPYPLEWTETLKEQIRKRDNRICQKCGKTQKQELKDLGQKLSIHHIDYSKENLNKNNLITLCNECNTKVNANRDYWFAYFVYIRDGLK